MSTTKSVSDTKTKKSASKAATKTSTTKSATKTSTTKTVAKSPKVKKSTRVSKTLVVENQEDRHQMIATAAYYRAEKSGFDSSKTMQDWLEAEMEIDRICSTTPQRVNASK